MSTQLAYISMEYYTRLEQARGPRPSRRVLAGIVRALRLSDAERDHLYHLAGGQPGVKGLLDLTTDKEEVHMSHEFDFRCSRRCDDLTREGCVRRLLTSPESSVCKTL